MPVIAIDTTRRDARFAEVSANVRRRGEGVDGKQK